MSNYIFQTSVLLLSRSCFKYFFKLAFRQQTKASNIVLNNTNKIKKKNSGNLR